MKYPIRFTLLNLMLLFVTVINAQNLCILQTKATIQPDPETEAALMFLNDVEHFVVSTWNLDELKSVDQLSSFQLIWFHHSDTTFEALPRRAKKALVEYVNNGGKLILSLEGARALNDLSLEENAVEVRNKKAEDSGYGRKLGMHAFRSHPVFDGLFGGSYIFKPHHDTTLRIIGFFDDHVPQNGKVIAVDWDYIFLREQSKLMLEYNAGKGKVLVIGAYTCLSKPNINRQHLRKFLFNCFNYMLGGESIEKERYWSYGPQQVIIDSVFNSEPIEINPATWPEPNDDGMLSRTSNNQFWDVAGERLLVMGHENNGIDEIWVHPFMALKDFKTELAIGPDLFELSTLKPQIEVRPKSFRRIYRTDRFVLEETIIADDKAPAAVIHYKYEGSKKASLRINFSSNLRLMWPYSESVLKELNAGFDTILNALHFQAENDEFNVLVGSNQKPANHLTASSMRDNCGDSCNFEAHGFLHFDLNPNSEMDIVIAADHRDTDSCLNAYKNAISSTLDFYISNTQKDPYNDKLQIISPDPVFNEGYAWAVRATDRFITHTPGLGTSLVAGIGTTDQGWDGGHKVNGRPGYAWYFGRDGEWSGLALLDYGDFEAVKKVLQMYQHFQDLNGKIYHEVSTSGIVHFDASDATPLYIVLAGRYLKHSGDVEFIRQNWNYINKAIDFCFSTDTDGDHLIENTNVGHGWVEGGGLFGSHSSLYLTACWAEALDEAAFMASALGNDALAAQWKAESELVTNLINRDFWNTETGFLNQGKFTDGSYHTEQTILPSIPIYFQQVESNKAGLMLPDWSSDGYSSDWGCRIVSKQSKLFNPRGYHTGSVWPLFTGWVSLAEYASLRPVQGYMHIMNNLLVYQNWGLGFIEEVLSGETYQPSGVCHHQCWSETMVLQPAIEGMLGIKADAVHHYVEIAPQLPANWDSLEVKNIRVGEHKLNLEMHRSEELVTWSLDHSGPSSIRILFDPQFEPGTKVLSVMSTGNFEDVRLSSLVPVEFYLDDHAGLNYKVVGGMRIISPIGHPQPGDNSTGLHLISEEYEDQTYAVRLQGLAGTTYPVELFVRDAAEMEVEGGKITGKNGSVYTIEITFAGAEGNYTDQTITFLPTGK